MHRILPLNPIKGKSFSLHNRKSKEARVVILARKTPLGLHPQPTKYYQQSSQHLGGMVCTISTHQIQRQNNYKKKKARGVILACDTTLEHDSYS